jgi:4-hydroxy-tetrahydrodipicolinate synthase
MTFNHTATGVYAIAVTPFLPDGRIDDASVDRMAEFYLGCGVTGLTILGIMGEAPKLEQAEAIAFAKRAISRVNVPVVVGVSAPGFSAMRSLTHAVMDAGAAGVMIAPLPSLRTDDQILGYYRQVVSAIGGDVPFVIQDYPLTLSVVMTPKVIRQIVMDHQSCVMLKHEDWPGLDKITALREFQSDGSLRPLSILTGNGGMFLNLELDRGADGAMTGYAFPDMLGDVVRLAKAGRRDDAHDLFDAHLPLIRYEQQLGVGLAARKYVLQRRGAIAHDTQRVPGSVLSAASRAEIDYLLARLARHDPRARLS